MNGDIWFESNSNGTKFFFEIEFKLKGDFTNINKPVQNITNDKFNLSDIKVLIVEDDKMNQKVIQQMLGMRNYIIDIASNGIEAIDKTKNNYNLELWIFVCLKWMELRQPKLSEDLVIKYRIYLLLL